MALIFSAFPALADEAHQSWDRLLKAYIVDEGGVNKFAYGKVTAADRVHLDRYIADLGRQDPEAMSSAAAQAFWINLYNARTVQLILDHYPVDSIRDIKPSFFSIGPWKATKTKVNGKDVSLHEIEHDILRAKFGDPRIHYAVNCASFSCPNLLATAWTADNLESLYEQATRDYVNHPRGVSFRPKQIWGKSDSRQAGAEEVVISRIYQWYRDDFGGSEKTVLDHIRRYANPALAERLKNITDIASYDYDWSLNEPKGDVQCWHNYLSLQAISDNRDALQDFVTGNFALAVLTYTIVYAISVALSLPGGAVLTILAGFLFGQIGGGVIAITGATIGAVGVFMIARTSLGEPLATKAGPWLDKMRDGFNDNAMSYLLFLRLVPLFPFWLVNLAPAFLGVSLRIYVIGTFVGIIPGTFAFAFLGSGLDSIIEEQRAVYDACLAGPDAASCEFTLNAGALITTELLVAFAALGLVALIPVVWKKFKGAHGRGKGAEFGVAPTEATVDFARAKDHVEEVIAAIAPHDSVERFEGLGCTVILGEGKFTTRRDFEVDGKVIRARRFVIATGSRPMVPPIPGLDETPYHTNETIFEDRTKPDHLIILGGGPIGLEMAQAHRRLGCKVTIVEMANAMGKDDPELAAIVLEKLRGEGIDIREQTKVVGVSGSDGSVSVKVEGPDGPAEISGSHLLVAAGRAPNVENLGLEEAGVEYDRGGIKVSAGLKTKNRRVFAIGDVIGGAQFTHMAGYHGGLVIRAALFSLPVKATQTLVPWVTYTDPELAHVGLTEAMARDQFGDKVKVLTWDVAENDRSQAERIRDGKVKVVLGKGGKILGASIVAPNAGDLLQPWILAMTQGLKIGAFTSMIVPYPTIGEVNKRVAGFVMLAEILIFVPSIAQFRIAWLEDRLAAAQIATLVLEAAPDDMVPDDLRTELLKNAEAKAVALKRDDSRQLYLQGDMPADIDARYDLRSTTVLDAIVDAFLAMGRDHNRTILVKGMARHGGGDYIEIVIDEMPLCKAMWDYGRNIFWLSLIISLITAALVYGALHLMLVRPMRDLTRNMLAFQDNPEDANRLMQPGSRSDEVGDAQRSLASMQTDVRAALKQKAHLAALGEAISRINHDLRNILAGAQLLSDRLEDVEDPTVKQLAPRLTAAIDRGVSLTTHTLKYGRADDDPPQMKQVLLRPLVAEAHSFLSAGGGSDLVTLKCLVPPDFEITADPDQIFRVLLNLIRNSAAAIASAGRSGNITISATRDQDEVWIDVIDQGPGIPDQVQAHLFEPFANGRSNGGSGLGLAIARDLMRGHGGDVSLIRTGPDGTYFRITLPDN
ncbi:merA [Symbiodinium microadriaticum]|nr:merA [Symbiodinium microadriaticum]